MKVIWAPWRMAYIKSARKPEGCIFCAKPRQRRDASNLVLYRGRHGFVIMNLFPYNSGHVMIAPYAHVDSVEWLSPEQALEMLALTTLSIKALRAEIRPEGFNVGINLGRVSGAGIERHVHVHVVPRWNGDTNFMPLFAETRVIPEHLRATYRKLRARFRVLARTESDARRLVAPQDGHAGAGQKAARAGRPARSGRLSGPHRTQPAVKPHSGHD